MKSTPCSFSAPLGALGDLGGRFSSRRGFTLVEVLVTISLIVLLLAIALPAFNFLTGGRSVEGATNQVSAFLGRARADAIGVQKIAGVMFFIDPRTGNVSCAAVQETDRPAGGTTGDPDFAAVDVYLDLTPDRDFMNLPAGVLLQTMDNGLIANGKHTSDGYIGYNTRGVDPVAAAVTTAREFGGVILFDGNGQLISRQYAFRTRRYVPPVGTGTGTFVATSLGRLLYAESLADARGDSAITGVGAVIPSVNLTRLTSSQIGAMIFDRGLFDAKGFSLADPQNDTALTYGTNSVGGNEYAEENDFIDAFGSAVLVNRYNGTLLRGE